MKWILELVLWRCADLIKKERANVSTNTFIPYVLHSLIQ